MEVEGNGREGKRGKGMDGKGEGKKWEGDRRMGNGREGVGWKEEGKGETLQKTAIFTKFFNFVGSCTHTLRPIQVTFGMLE